jgi:hypothetical protein
LRARAEDRCRKWVSGDWDGFGDLGEWHAVEVDFDTAAFPTR